MSGTLFWLITVTTLIFLGPYYRYRTFDDYFNLPFSKHADCFLATINTLKIVPLHISLYLGFSNIWPLEVSAILLRQIVLITYYL